MHILTFFTHSFFICLFIQISTIPIILWTKKPHIMDVFWGIGIATSAISMIRIYSDVTLSSMIVLGFIFIWATRLAGFLIYSRILEDHHDRRYEMLNKTTLFRTTLKQCFFQAFFQALMVITIFPLISLTSLQPLFLIISCIVFIMALIFESIADFQLYRHKKNNTELCQVGLWQFSRHPNYFFECLLWAGISLSFLPNIEFFISFIGPMTIFITMYFITGPLTERASLRKHGIHFQNYRKKTAYFFLTKPKDNA